VIVVADTSPITALLRIKKADLLLELFEEISIPEAVRSELLRYHHSLPRWLVVGTAQNESELSKLRIELDAGEAEAIILAQEIQSDYLLMDERKGRRIAMSKGLRVIGLLGIVLLAKERKSISSAREMLAELEKTAGMYLASSLRETALRSVGEK